MNLNDENYPVKRIRMKNVVCLCFFFMYMNEFITPSMCEPVL